MTFNDQGMINEELLHIMGGSDLLSNKESEAKKSVFLRVNFEDPSLRETQGGLVVVDVFNGINSINQWAVNQSRKPLPNEYLPEVDQQMVVLMDEVEDQIELLKELMNEINVYKNTSRAPLQRIAFSQESEQAEFLDIDIKDLAGMTALLEYGLGIYTHDIKTPFTNVYTSLQLNLRRSTERKKSSYEMLFSIINSNISRINHQVERGSMDLMANLEFVNKGMDLDTLRKACFDQLDRQLITNEKFIGPVRVRFTVDEDVPPDIVVAGNDFWYGFLISDVAKNMVNAFNARKHQEGRMEDAASQDDQFQRTIDQTQFSKNPEVEIPELLKDRSERNVVYRICKSPDGHGIEVRIYDNAIGYKEKIITEGFKSEDGFHGYDSGKIHSQGYGMVGHVEIMRKYGTKLIPSNVEDSNGENIPRAGLLRIVMPC